MLKFEDIQNQKKKYENIIIANERIDESGLVKFYNNNSTFAKVGFVEQNFQMMIYALMYL